MGFKTAAGRRAWAVLLVLVFLFISPIPALTESEPELAPTPAATQDTYNADAPGNLNDGNIVARSAIVIDADSGRMLYGKAERERMFPASTTKVMTLLLALEFGHLDDQITIPEEASKIPGDSSLVPVNIGEKMIFRDLLYGFMMNSGNDAGNAIAVIVAGSLEAFADRMNERARELGCEDTHFVNAHGYHDENHYTTAYDLALITREAMKNETFRQIVSAESYTMAKTNLRDPLPLSTKNAMMQSTSPHYYKPIVGVKTGYTSKAGQCFVGAAHDNGKQLISVVFFSSREGKWQDTRRLMEYAYTRYEKYSFSELYQMSPIYVAVRNAHEEDSNGGMLMLNYVPGGPDSVNIMCLKDELNDELADFKGRLSVQYSRDLVAPLSEGDILGTLTYTTDSGEALQTTLLASRDVALQPTSFSIEDMLPDYVYVNFDMIKFILVVVAGIIVLIVYLRIRSGIRRRRRRKEMQRRRREGYGRGR